MGELVYELAPVMISRTQQDPNWLITMFAVEGNGSLWFVRCNLDFDYATERDSEILVQVHSDVI